MTYSEEIAKKSFSHEVSKKAYLESCKWLAQNVYNNDELSKSVMVQYEKTVNEEQLPTFVVTLHYVCNEDIKADEYCQKCKQLHTLLYSVEKPNCNECKMSAFRKYKKDYVKGIIDFYKEVFKDK